MTQTQQPTGIVTPEAVVLEFDTAGAGSRLVAESLDILLQLFALFVVFFAMALAAAGLQSIGWIAIAALFLATFLIIVGYPVAMETLWNGRTLGKAALGLRVVTEEGGPIRFRHAALRGIIGVFEIWLLQGLPALLAIILSKKNQRLGDMAAGTIVLRERSAGGEATAVAFPPPPGYESYVSSLDVSSLNTEQYGVIRSFLMRVFELTPAARATLALRLANPVAVQLHHTPPQMVSPELFLACVASAFQLRHGGPATSWGTPGFGGAPAYGAPPPGSYSGPGAVPGYGAPPPHYGAPSGYGGPPPGYGPQPGYGAPPSGYGAQPPAYGSGSTYGGAPTGYPGAPAGYGPGGYGAQPAATFSSPPRSGVPAAAYGQRDPGAFPGDPGYGGSDAYGGGARPPGPVPGRYGDQGPMGGTGPDAPTAPTAPTTPPSSGAAFGRGTLSDPPLGRTRESPPEGHPPVIEDTDVER